MQKQYLTKSKFKVGLSCPTKLFFTQNSSEYTNSSSSDPFTAALAEGGFQVGELAKIEYNGGIEVHETNHEIAWNKTRELLNADTVTIFEAAILHNDLFVRVDILQKIGNKLEVIEVKSKSYDTNKENQFLTKKPRADGSVELKSAWEPYVLDLAFQTYVVSKAFPEIEIKPFLLLADKNARATVDGLNQMFLIRKDENRRISIEKDPNLSEKTIGSSILCKIDMTESVKLTLADKVVIFEDKILGSLTFSSLLLILQKSISTGKKVETFVGKRCKECEFKIPAKDLLNGQKSGFNECWSKATGKSINGSENFVFDIWNWSDAGSHVENGIFFFEQLDSTKFEPVIDLGMTTHFSRKQRQWMQLVSHLSNSIGETVLTQALADAISSYKFPFHFIDFETTATAIPFFKGAGPYTQIAFQFSHHIMRSDRSVEHAGQFFFEEQGRFPNFEFIRELYRQLSTDEGTIFRYASHENSILSTIANQLSKSDEPDRKQLISFIRSITEFSDDDGTRVTGRRSMVDMCDLVKLYYYSPLMKGSNSIKKVLPAVLVHSEYLKMKYAAPLYGAKEGVKSLNFTNWKWLDIDRNEVLDPYKKLPRLFDPDMEKDTEWISNSSQIADGGAAMTAYAKMQFSKMPFSERQSLKEALLKYCELDTLAMVMIFEHWLYDVLDVKAHRLVG